MNLAELLRANRTRRFRTQSGTIIERRGQHPGFYLRYYIDRDGERVKVTEWLCHAGEKATVVEI